MKIVKRLLTLMCSFMLVFGIVSTAFASDGPNIDVYTDKHHHLAATIDVLEDDKFMMKAHVIFYDEAGNVIEEINNKSYSEYTEGRTITTWAAYLKGNWYKAQMTFIIKGPDGPYEWKHVTTYND